MTANTTSIISLNEAIQKTMHEIAYTHLIDARDEWDDEYDVTQILRFAFEALKIAYGENKGWKHAYDLALASIKFSKTASEDVDIWEQYECVGEKAFEQHLSRHLDTDIVTKLFS